jgi:hypothetical protein
VTVAADPAPYGPCADWFGAGAYSSPVPTPPDPDDDPTFSPDTEWNPAPRTSTPQVRAELAWAFSREPIGFLDSALVEEWDEDVEILAGSTAGITVASNDPLWAQLGGIGALTADGLVGYDYDPKRLIVNVWREDRGCVWSGLLSKPIDIGGGRVVLPAVGPQDQFNRRTLGRPQQQDLYSGRGSFERYGSKAQMEADGWIFPPGVEAQIVYGDAVRGNRSLRIRAAAGPLTQTWVRGPAVLVEGAQGYGRVLDGQVFGKWNEIVPEGGVVARVALSRLGSGQLAEVLYRDENSGIRPDERNGWTEAPVTFAGRMEPVAATHGARLEIAAFPGVWSYYDLLEPRLSVQSGFPYGTTRDLSEIADRYLRDFVARSLGGHPTGMRRRIVSMTGRRASSRWSHAQRTAMRDVLASVLEQPEGPELRVTPNWDLEIHARLGRRRPDVCLSAHNVKVEWSEDPGAQYEDTIADTGRGGGVNWLAAVYSARRDDSRFRSMQLVQAPVGRSLNESDAWVRAHGRVAAAEQVSAELSCSWDTADSLAVGDEPFLALGDGLLAKECWVRVLRKRYRRGGMASLFVGFVL